VAHQREAISHLEGVGGGLSAGQRIGVRAVANQDDDRGMRLQPRGQRLSGAPFEDGDQLTSFPSHEPRARRATTTQRTLIHAPDPRRRKHEVFGALPADEGVRARHIAHPASDPRGHLRTCARGEFPEDPSPALGLPRIARPHRRERFHKHPPWAGRIVTAEPAGVYDQLHRPAPPGHIPGAAMIATMDPAAGSATHRTSSCGAQGFQV
jgi:hypothetical protein